MKKYYHVPGMFLVGITVLTTLLLAGCSAQPDGPAPVQAASVLPAAGSVNTPAASTDGTPQEGITVHGQWTIDVINPDGTSAGHYEFENALAYNGKSALVQLLGRQNSVGAWAIGLVPQGFVSWDTSTSPWSYGGYFGGSASAMPGLIGETGAYLTVSNDLQLEVDTSTNPSLRLKGSLHTTKDVIIGQVETVLYKLSSALPPQNASGTEGFTSQVFTQKNLDEPVALQAGQTVQVTVVISFS